MALRITFLHQLGAAAFLVTLTLWLQYAGFTALITWIRRAVASDIHELGPFRSAALVVQFIYSSCDRSPRTIAGCYRWLCFPSWESALYFSPSSYAPVGYGDVVLPSEWRILGPLEGIVGLILFYLQ